MILGAASKLYEVLLFSDSGLYTCCKNCKKSLDCGGAQPAVALGAIIGCETIVGGCINTIGACAVEAGWVCGI